MKLSIVFGPPLSGKTTFAQSLLSENMIHISVGNICRKESQKNNSLGELLRKSISDNLFIDSDILLPLLFDKYIARNNGLSDNDCEYILDGFPKYSHEVQPFLRYATDNDITLSKIYCLNVEFDELLYRCRNRYVCDKCYIPSTNQNICRCGGKMYKRNEDSIEYFMERYKRYLDHYNDILSELTDHFKEVVQC